MGSPEAGPARCPFSASREARDGRAHLASGGMVASQEERLSENSGPGRHLHLLVLLSGHLVLLDTPSCCFLLLLVFVLLLFVLSSAICKVWGANIKCVIHRIRGKPSVPTRSCVPQSSFSPLAAGSLGPSEQPEWKTPTGIHLSGDSALECITGKSQSIRWGEELNGAQNSPADSLGWVGGTNFICLQFLESQYSKVPFPDGLGGFGGGSPLRRLCVNMDSHSHKVGHH